MKFSGLTERTAGDGVDAWQVHYDALARLEAGDDIILLSVGQETEERTPAHIVDAAIDSLRAGRHHYPPVSGNHDLRRAVADYHFQRTGQRVSEANCAIFAGAQNALFAVAQCILEAGDEVILSAPYYTTYPATFTASGAALVSVPVKAKNQFQIDPGDIIKAMTRRTRAVVLNSPNNPLGVVYSRERYAPIVRACVERGIWLIADDVYQELLTEEELRERGSPATLPGAGRVCVSVSSLSKSHRMTGWRIGWVVGPEELVRHLYHLAVCMSYGLPAFIQDAALAALAGGTATAREIRRHLDRRRDLVLRQLGGVPGLELFSAAGGMFVVFDISGMTAAVSARRFARGLLERHNVAILPCDGFGAAGARLLRVSLCVDEQRLEDACGRIADYVDSLH
ncbi:MAG: pyridoxal phosphate-dependent aminotransferase [Gammaproteobacteria bacterium]|nr:pyridoxal phosphate-dependent aminotransferase [Gammaproteobacteria bacterium]